MALIALCNELIIDIATLMLCCSTSSALILVFIDFMNVFLDFITVSNRRNFFYAIVPIFMNIVG